jgi:AraC-like DNA-binding protein
MDSLGDSLNLGSEVFMPSSALREFTDPDDYAAAIRLTRSEMMVTRRGDFAAKIVWIDLHRLLMCRFSDNLPRVAHVANTAERAFVSFPTKPGPSLFTGGLEMHQTRILRYSRAQEHHSRSSGSAGLASMSLPIEDMAAVGQAMGGCDLSPPRDAILVTAPPDAMARLQRLHAAAGRLAEEAPEVLANPDAARGLEQALIEALVECLGRGRECEHTLAQGQHAIVMRRFRRVLEENPEQPLYIPDICNAIKVSDRTLRMCCQEHLGMSPKRYLLLRRMVFVRRALRAAGPDAATVTDVATRYGFWQLGRFAVDYRSLFGEAPSATLQRQSG